MAKIKIAIEIDTDDLFEAVNRHGELDREKFDAMVLTAKWQAELVEVMWCDFLAAQEQDASCMDEGLFEDAVADYEE